MIDVQQSTVIGRPAKSVFAFVSDQTNAPRWQRGLTEVQRLTDGPVGVGTRHRFVRRLMGRQMAGENEYTRYEPGEFVAFKATSGGWPLEASYRVEQHGVRGTRLTAKLEIRPTGPFRLLEPLIAAALRRDVEANLAALKGLLEASSQRI